MRYVCTIIAHIPGEAIWIERVAGANEVHNDVVQYERTEKSLCGSKENAAARTKKKERKGEIDLRSRTRGKWVKMQTVESHVRRRWEESTRKEALGWMQTDNV
jgi:hypothetical protein